MATKTETQARVDAEDALGTTAVTVSAGEGHSGTGWYGWATEYPEDGSVYLGPCDVDEEHAAARRRARRVVR